jgi:hypothetical protein
MAIQCTVNKCTKEVYASDPDLCLQSRYRGDGDGQFTCLRMRGVRESNLIFKEFESLQTCSISYKNH